MIVSDFLCHALAGCKNACSRDVGGGWIFGAAVGGAAAVWHALAEQVNSALAGAAGVPRRIMPHLNHSASEGQQRTVEVALAACSLSQ